MPKPAMTTQTRFPLLGEPLAIDLVNTHVLQRGSHVDLLDRPSAVAAWLRAERGRIAWRGPVDVVDLVAVRALRDATEVLLRARLERALAQESMVRQFNRALAVPSARTRLEWTAAGPRKSLPAANAQRDTLIRALALDALEILTGPQAGLLRQCAHPACRLLFVARNPRRRWCSGAICGNRARVARHDAIGRRAI
jgi:predicted RNA-binding Zn ribbon-like protein